MMKKLLADVQAIDSNISDISALYMHFVEMDAEINA
jgi:hypothetical protein